MQNEFTPLHLKRAKKRLAMILREKEKDLEEDRMQYRELQKRKYSWWRRFLQGFRGR